MITPLHRRKPTETYYVSGPMRDIPKFNFPMFDSCSSWLRSQGFGAINPADHDREIDPDCESKPGFATGDESLNDDPNMHFQALLGWDLQQISAHSCTGIVMLPGWEKSRGAAHERYVAEACGKQVWLAHFTGTTAIGSPAHTIEYHGWYMTLCDDRLLSSFTAEGLRAALSPTIHDPNHGLDRDVLKARGYVEREPDTFARDMEHVRQGSPFTHEPVRITPETAAGFRYPHDNIGINPYPNGMGAAGQVSKMVDPYAAGRARAEAYKAKEAQQIGQFQTKDSGVREEFTSGMVRDTQDGKPRYDLIPLAPLKRMAELYARGAQKYGDRNWEKATGSEEMERFKASGLRHFYQALMGDRDEDHWAGAVFNIFGAMWLEERLSTVPSVMENDKVQRPDDDGKP